MKTDNELLMLAEWMEAKPTEKATRHKNFRLKTVSPKGWWCVERSLVSPPMGDSDPSQMIPDYYKIARMEGYIWTPNKDPRMSIEAAMEVVLHCAEMIRDILSNFDSWWDLCEIPGCDSDTGDPRIFYECGFVQEVDYAEVLIAMGTGDTPQEAIFAAVVKLIKYLKEKEEVVKNWHLGENKMWTGEGDNEPA